VIPELPEGWQASLAAAGAIVVVVLLLRWMAVVMNRMFDVIEKIITDHRDDGDDR
jgi:hypothetical protein